MASVSMVNPRAEIARAGDALQINVSAAQALQEILSTNLGPKGTYKMLVSGGGDIKITKDGTTLLGEMQIQHPTASLIARAATSQDETSGDGTTSVVLLIGEILKQSQLKVMEGVHPRLLTEGFEIARKVALEALSKLEIKKETIDRDTLLCVARSSLRTKLHKDIADCIADAVVDSVLCLMEKNNTEVDLFMVEIMEMIHQLDVDSKLVKGLVLDHGGRHPSMPKELKDCYIFTCNVSFEYDKSEVNSSFFYKSGEERQKMALSERKFTDAKVQKVIDLKNKVCTKENGKKFVVINQKGIDPIALEMFSNEGILALRRAKRRNMERLVKCCGGEAMNSVEELTPECLGKAGLVYQMKINEENFTFVEDTPYTDSVTILIKGPAKHTVSQIKDAIRDGLRAVKNCINFEKKSLVNLLPGCGAPELFIYNEVIEYIRNNSLMKEQYGLQAFADAILIIVKTLAKNGGYDPQEVLLKMQNSYKLNKLAVGIDLETGESVDPITLGVYDNLYSKRQMISSCLTISSNLLLVDELLRAGLTSVKGQQ